MRGLLHRPRRPLPPCGPKGTTMSLFAATLAVWPVHAFDRTRRLRRRRRSALTPTGDPAFRLERPVRPKGSSGRDRVWRFLSASKNKACWGGSHGSRVHRPRTPQRRRLSPREQAIIYSPSLHYRAVIAAGNEWTPP